MIRLRSSTKLSHKWIKINREFPDTVSISLIRDFIAILLSFGKFCTMQATIRFRLFEVMLNGNIMRFQKDRITGIVTIFCWWLVLCCSLSAAQPKEPTNHKVAIVIHGGAGTIDKGSLTVEMESQYREKLTEALSAGYKILTDGGTSMDAVEAAIKMMEDSPLFNAGKGAVYTHDRTIELDASIMDGKTLKAGAVAGVKHIKNPIHLARLVMEKTWHVMLTGDGAEKFAHEQGIELVPQEYFKTERRWKQIQDILEREREDLLKNDSTIEKHGTVGCVALDSFGNLAAGTSTGGMTNKRFGRVGDSPIIGAGTYADNGTCGISCTGDGEYFIRLGVAKDISDLMKYKKMSITDAAQAVVDKVTTLGGTGGVIGLDKDGNIAMPFNTSGMYRAFIDGSRVPVIKIYKD
jgi:L-asparaginase / beta-aspartyl-peptidase